MTIPVGARKLPITKPDLVFLVGNVPVGAWVEEGFLGLMGHVCEMAADGSWYSVNSFEIDSQDGDTTLAHALTYVGDPNGVDDAHADAWYAQKTPAQAAVVIKKWWVDKIMPNFDAAVTATYGQTTAQPAPPSGGNNVDYVGLFRFMVAHTQVVVNTATGDVQVTAAF